jgi:hypothetical protein
MKKTILYKQKLVDALKVLFFWTVSILFAWLLGRFSWAILEILFSGFRESKIGDVFIDEVLFSSRIAFLGVAITSIIFLLMSLSQRVDYKIHTKKLMTGDFLPYSLLLILTAYIVIAWNGQSVYWWHTNATQRVANDIESALLFITYSVIRAVSIFFILTSELWRYIFTKFPVRLSTKLFWGRIGSFGIIHFLCYWASMPNANLGLPATSILVVLAAMTGIFSIKHRKAIVEKEVEIG